MTNTLIVANWKSNKTISESIDFLLDLSQNFKKIPGKELILCPPFTSIHAVRQFISQKNIDIKLGAQDVSSFDEGAYTGEINAKQIKELCEYVLIGHSERRKNFSEEDNLLFEKSDRALKQDLQVIYCVQNESTNVPQGDIIVAYEPPSSISTSGPDAQIEDPQKVISVATYFKNKTKSFLYGGSIDGENVRNFTSENNIDGVLIGGKSLFPQELIKIYENA